MPYRTSGSTGTARKVALNVKHLMTRESERESLHRPEPMPKTEQITGPCDMEK